MSDRHPVVQTMKASEARQQFSQLLNKVFRRESRVLVEKSGIPVAAIISAQDLERLDQLERQRAERFKALEQSWKAFKDVSPEDVERDVAKAVAQARQKHRKQSQRTATAS